MSYEPRLIIRRSDLEKNRFKIAEECSKFKNMPLQRAYSELQKALDDKYPIVFAEISLTIIQPELTEHNGRVRKLLHDLDIDFKTDY